MNRIILMLMVCLGMVALSPAPPGPRLMIFPYLTLQRPWQPASDTCADFGHCGHATGGVASVYWRGMNGVTSLHIKLDGLGPIGGCPPGLSQIDYDAAPVAQGAASWTGLARGFYIVRVDATGPQGQAYHNEHPFKLDCEF